MTNSESSCTIVHMPKPNGRTWRHCRAKMDITSDQAAALLGITGGALRQIETNIKPVSLRLAYRAESLYKTPVSDLLANDEDKPEPKDDKPPEPKVEPIAPPRRRNGKHGRTGPRRDEMSASAGAA